MARTLHVSAVVRVPVTPNFLKLHGTGGALPLDAFPREDLEAVGKAWTEALIERAEEMARRRKAEEVQA